MDGIVNIWKPSGMTSHDAVAKVRRAAGTRRVGHTGTLDPMAEGVLPICIGKATHAVDYIVAARKTYLCQMKLGVSTDTQDKTGTIIEERPVHCTEEQIRKIAKQFVGEKAQIPPMYSAVHHNGKRLYQLARQGVEVERKPRPVTFFAISFLEIQVPMVTFLVTCSKGAYIRTLCHDIGEALGCGGHMTSLVRNASGQFTRDNAVALADFEASPKDHILPIESVFADLPKVRVTAEEERRIRNGATIGYPDGKEERYAVFSEDGTLLCLSQGIMGKRGIYLKMLTSFY